MEEQNSDNKKGDYNAQSTVEEFVQKQTELIELEKQEEVEKIERLLDSLPRTVIKLFRTNYPWNFAHNETRS
jgi:hypothetical protein